MLLMLFTLVEEIIRIREKLYIENPEKWLNKYIESFKNSALFYDKKRYFSEARVPYEQALCVIKELYKENIEEWMKKNIISLNNLAFLTTTTKAF